MCHRQPFVYRCGHPKRTVKIQCRAALGCPGAIPTKREIVDRKNECARCDIIMRESQAEARRRVDSERSKALACLEGRGPPPFHPRKARSIASSSRSGGLNRPLPPLPRRSEPPRHRHHMGGKQRKPACVVM